VTIVKRIVDGVTYRRVIDVKFDAPISDSVMYRLIVKGKLRGHTHDGYIWTEYPIPVSALEGVKMGTSVKKRNIQRNGKHYRIVSDAVLGANCSDSYLYMLCRGNKIEYVQEGRYKYVIWPLPEYLRKDYLKPSVAPVEITTPEPIDTQLKILAELERVNMALTRIVQAADVVKDMQLTLWLRDEAVVKLLQQIADQTRPVELTSVSEIRDLPSPGWLARLRGQSNANG
jgi:hypothetical protein